MSTRSPEPTWDACPNCDAVVPAEAAFCPECGEPLAARRPSTGARRRRRAFPLSGVALGIAAVAVIGLGALLGLLLTGDDGRGVADATPSPTPSASLTASEAPTETAEPTPSPSPTATPRPALANREIAEIVTDGLELRTQPGGGDVIGTFGTGSRAFVIGAPQDLDGERWYRVAVAAGPFSRCEAGVCPDDIGFVSDGTSDADANLAAAALDCPSSPMAAAELDALTAFERLSCYGGNPIVITGTLDHCYCDGPIGVEYEPLWLALPIAEFLFDGSFTLFLRFEDPPGTPQELEPGDVVEVTVAMEHEDAPDCTVRSTIGQPVESRAQAVLACRTRLVVEEIEVTGHDPDAVGP